MPVAHRAIVPPSQLPEMLAQVVVAAAQGSGKELPPVLRGIEPGAAADVIARLKLDGPQRRTLIPVLAKSGPLELPKLLAAFDNDADPETGRQLVAALTDSAAAKGLRPHNQVGHHGLGRMVDGVNPTR